MSLQSIRNGLYTTLTACGPWAASEISTCSFGVLEAVSACAIVYLPGPTSTFEQLTYGKVSGGDRAAWGISGAVYIKHTGDDEQLLSRCWQAHDDIYATISKDRTLDGAADNAYVAQITFDKDVSIEAAGAMWAIIDFQIVADELNL